MMNNSSAFTFRNARREDAPIIVRFLHELAEHDGHGSECHITVDDIIQFGFSENPKFEVTLLEIEGKAQGLALYFMTFSIWAASPCLFVSDLYISDHCRGLGIGRQMFSHLSAISRERGCERIEWQVLYDADAVEFYNNIGGKIVEGFHTYRLEGKSLEMMLNS